MEERTSREPEVRYRALQHGPERSQVAIDRARLGAPVLPVDGLAFEDLGSRVVAGRAKCLGSLSKCEGREGGFGASLAEGEDVPLSDFRDALVDQVRHEPLEGSGRLGGAATRLRALAAGFEVLGVGLEQAPERRGSISLLRCLAGLCFEFLEKLRLGGSRLRLRLADRTRAPAVVRDASLPYPSAVDLDIPQRHVPLP